MKNYNRTPLANTDAYKLSHWPQYPKGTTGVYSNLTPRKSRRPGIDKFGKRSASGFLRVHMMNGEYALTQSVSEEGGAMVPVYENSQILRTQSFAQLREELAKF